ncbi:MAG: polar amino acid transport system substrate-binding protein [Motiliproteus sp.]|jgi:polar amino acid transport system substrate-binding protein
MNTYAVQALEKVSVQLPWKYQFEFAGFIVAKEKGYYRDVGLEVDLLEYEDDIDIVEKVLSGRVDFGIYNTPFISKNGWLEPTVLLAIYFQQSPLVFVTQPDIKKPSQLVGKKIMATDFEFLNSSLSLLLKRFFIDKKNSAYVSHSFSIDAFKDKKIDAMSAYTSNQLYDLDRQNIPYNIIDPADYGFTTSADNLFTSYEKSKKEPLKIIKFLEATKKGWAYSLDNVDEVVELIHEKYNPSKSIEALKYEAEVTRSLMLLGLYDIGETNKELMTRAYKQLVKSGKLQPNQDLGALVFSDVVKEEQESTSVLFSEEEDVFLKQKGIIRLCVDPNWMPYESIKNGKHIGIVADYFDVLRKNSGLNITLKVTKSWAESVEAVKNRECDLLSAATSTPQRLEFMDFTDQYLNPPVVLTTTLDKKFIANIEEVKEQKLGVSKGYALAEILRAKYKGINIVDVENIGDGLDKVESGEIYGYLDNLIVIAHAIQGNFSSSLKVTARLDETDGNSIASRNDEPLLHSIFQKAIESVDGSKKQDIFNNGISIKESVGIDPTLVVEIISVVFIVLMLFLMYLWQLKKYNKKLQYLSREDFLTKLSNRKKLDEILEEQHRYTLRYKTTCGVIILDIDDFKKINDTYGHLEGDEVLKQFAAILNSNVRETDTVGRWGGEEFLIICPNSDMENLKHVAEKIRLVVDNTPFSKGQHVTSSFGLSYIDGSKNSDKVLKEADGALYFAKTNGKNRVGVFENGKASV